MDASLRESGRVQRSHTTGAGGGQAANCRPPPPLLGQQNQPQRGREGREVLGFQHILTRF